MTEQMTGRSSAPSSGAPIRASTPEAAIGLATRNPWP